MMNGMGGWGLMWVFGLLLVLGLILLIVVLVMTLMRRPGGADAPGAGAAPAVLGRGRAHAILEERNAGGEPTGEELREHLRTREDEER
jgi:putative membrane protein